MDMVLSATTISPSLLWLAAWAVPWRCESPQGSHPRASPWVVNQSQRLTLLGNWWDSQPGLPLTQPFNCGGTTQQLGSISQKIGSRLKPCMLALGSLPWSWWEDRRPPKLCLALRFFQVVLWMYLVVLCKFYCNSNWGNTFSCLCNSIDVLSPVSRDMRWMCQRL